MTTRTGSYQASTVRVTFYIDTATVEEAREVAALFPKSVNARAKGLWGSAEHKGTVTMVAKLAADGANGGVNETGLRRARRFVKVCQDHGIQLDRHKFSDAALEDVL